MGPCRLLKTIFAQFLGKYRVVSALFGKIERLTFTGTFDAFQHLVKSHSFKQICFPHRSEMGVLKSFPKSATNSLLYNLERSSVSRVLPGGTMAGSAIHAGSAPELPCRWPTTVVCSRMFMTRAAGGLVLAAPFSNRVFQEFLLLLHEAWATVFALSRVLWGSEQLFLDARGHRSRTMLKSHKSVMKITKSCRKV